MSNAEPNSHVFYRKMGQPRPIIAYGEGIYLYDEYGKRYIDGSGGPFVVNVGHGRAEIVEAIAEQARAASYVHATMFTSESLEAYASALAEVMPIPEARIYPLSSGSEVVEGALKLARQIQMARGENKRHVIISRAHSYHGMTLGALSVSGRPGMRAPFLPMIRDVPHIWPPYPYRYPASGEALAGRLEEAILLYGPANVAAFVAESISGASLGAVVPPDDYWPRIRQICDRYGVLLIVDEVLVGFGRTGKWWGIDHWGVTPDILVASKGIAGGYYPLGIIAARGADVNQIRQALGDFSHGGTFSHHAVAAAAGLATLRILQEEKLVERSGEMGAYLGRRLQESLGDHRHIGDIRGRGLFWALEFVQDRASKAPFPADRHLATALTAQAFERGLIVYHSQGCANGRDGDLIMVGPPFTVNEGQIDEVVELLTSAVKAELA